MKTAVKYGLIIGLLSFAWLMAEYFLGFRTDNFGTHLTTAPFVVGALVVAIVGAIYTTKNERGSGYGFKQGFITGVVVAVIAGAVMTVGQYVYYFVDPDYANRAKAWSTYVQVLDGTPLEEAKANTQDGAWKHNTNVKALGQIPLFLLQGALISVVASPIVTRKKK